MRSILGVVLAIVFVALVAVDPLVCPDGCNEHGVEIAPLASPCVICLGLGPTVSHFIFEPIESVLPAVTVAGTLPERLVSYPIEHPPQRT